MSLFWTFPLSKTRVFLAGINFVILAIMLIYLRSRLPMSGAQLPMIGKEGNLSNMAPLHLTKPYLCR